MRVLTDLEPKNVFSFFEDICSIPHPSYKEEKISNYLVEFAKARGLEHYQDELHNVIIIKEASEGYEDVEPIILQGHMDMVCEKAPDCDKDMDEEGEYLIVGAMEAGHEMNTISDQSPVEMTVSRWHMRLLFWTMTVCHIHALSLYALYARRSAWRVLQASMCLCLRERSFLIWTARRRA